MKKLLLVQLFMLICFTTNAVAHRYIYPDYKSLYDEAAIVLLQNTEWETTGGRATESAAFGYRYSYTELLIDHATKKRYILIGRFSINAHPRNMNDMLAIYERVTCLIELKELD